MSKRFTGGFALLEVVVAAAMLAVSTLLIAQVLGAALDYARAAEAGRRAEAVAAAVAHTFDDGADYPAGWRLVGTPGADGVPGTRDDGPPDGSEPPCWLRLGSASRGAAGSWLWVEVTCSGAAEGPPPTAPVEPTAGVFGGRMGRAVTLAAPR